MANGARIQFSSHTNIQWEWAHGSEQIRLLEPCDHLDPAIAELFDDERLVGQARTALGLDAVALFTSKLNLKRAREGSEFPWHQDYPYWYAACREDAADMVTAIVFLDDVHRRFGLKVTLLSGEEEARLTYQGVRSEVLDPDALTIGFARRFATYKRGTLIFKNLERMTALINSKEFLFNH